MTITTTTPTTPRPWELLASALFVFGAILAAVDLIGATAVLALGSSRSTTEVGAAVGSLFFVFFVGEGVWIWQTRQLLRSLHDDAGWLHYQWAFVTALALILLAGGAVPLFVDVLPKTGLLLIVDALRLGSFVFGLVGLRLTRDRVRGIASGEIAPHSDDPDLLPPIVPTATVRYDTVPVAGKLAPADDAFWAAAGRLAQDAGADLALLETTETLVRRWLLVPAAGDTAALRATIRPGAVLTLFTTAPGALNRPAPASEYYGLIQSAPDAAIRFQLVLPSRVPGFLAEAHTAHRAALYRSNDPAAHTAAVPTG